MITVLLTCYI